MAEQVLKIKSNDRLIAVGRTGSGKTYLMERLTAPLTRLVVLDPKSTLRGRFGLADWDSRGRKLLHNGEPCRLRVTAPPLDDTDSFYEDILAECYSVGNLVVYIDELYLISTGQKVGKWLRACYTTGRELGIGVWGATQRPVWVPLFTLSESDWFFVFQLLLYDDRKRMAEILGPELLAEIPDKHGFWLKHITWQRARYYPRVK